MKLETKQLKNKPEKLILYHFVGCPYCSIAREPIDRLGIDVELRDTMKDPQYRTELINERGRGTVPVLRIINSNGEEKWMPESRDIVRYLECHFNS
ncbi:glutaredoxin family protein [Photobacterium satsumensis]|uniref:glutaredoxin family protein n=1 Tax=Photobacterium satsumensis TaxID=2910239 RepID=UPI003D1371EC